MFLIPILSFLLDGIFFSFLSPNTLLCPLFSILTLVIMYPFFSSNYKGYLFLGGILGLFYDICYANTLFLNFFLFLGIGLFVYRVFKHFAVNVLNTYLLGMGVVFLYRVFHCFFFVVLGFTTWNFKVFWNGILSSIILNSFYLVLFYFIARIIRKYQRKEKYRLLKVKKS